MTFFLGTFRPIKANSHTQRIHKVSNLRPLSWQQSSQPTGHGELWTMTFKRETFTMKKVPLRSFNLRSISTAKKSSLKQKFKAELALVRSAIDKIKEQIKIEAQIRTVAAQKEKSALKMKIKKEREASRLALEKMEATVEMNDFNKVMKELKGIGCQNISFYDLRQLGLLLKDDDFDDHKTAHISVLPNDEIEEGEISI